MSMSAPQNRSSGRASVPATPVHGRATARVGSAAPYSRSDDALGGGSGRGPGGGGTGGSVPPGRGRSYSGRRRPRWGRIALVAGVGLLILALLAAGGSWIYYRNIDSDLKRTDPFAAITGGRPAKVAAGAMNILLLGSDSRDPENAARAGEWRTDTLILLHVPESHDKAYLISIPRDLYVPVPDHGRAKINAAFAWGGIPLTVRTIEGFTDVHIDHVVLVDFGGFKQVTDALGGVDMNIEQDVKSIHQPFRQFKKGMQHLDGAEALDYVRQRKQFPDGDFARMRHQQQFMKALLDKAASGGTLTNPLKLNAFLKATTKAMTVDQDFSIADAALQFRGIRSEDLTFMVHPFTGTEDINGENVVVSDREKASGLYDAVKQDKVAEWVTQNSPAPKPTG